MIGISLGLFKKMQHKPKKINRPLPDGWDEKEIREKLSGSYDELFGEFTKNGILKVTPKVIKKILKEEKK